MRDEVRAEQDLLLLAHERELCEQLVGEGALERACLLSLRPGAGGRDAEDWTEQLLSAYLAYAARRGWKAQILEESRNEMHGLRSITLQLSGGYGLLRAEEGSHRVQHLSRFGVQGKRQTSFAGVSVLPVITRPESVLQLSEVQFTVSAGSSKGGQHANKAHTNVRALHLPTGLTAFSGGRSQLQNRKAALSVLAARVAEQLTPEREEARVQAGFGHRRRSYSLHPYLQVLDQRAGLKSSAVNRVLGGEMDELSRRALWQQLPR